MIFLLFPISTFFVKNFVFSNYRTSQILLHAFSCRCFMADLSVRFGLNLPRAFHMPIYRYDFLTFSDFHFFRQKLHFSNYGTCQISSVTLSVVDVLWPISASDLDETCHVPSIRQSIGMIFIVFPISTFFRRKHRFSNYRSKI